MKSKSGTQEHLLYISARTYSELPFFEEDIFSEIFIDVLNFGCWMNQFEVYGYRIGRSGIQMIMRLQGEAGCGKIMQNLKRVSSLHVNQVMGFTGREGGNIYSRLEWPDTLAAYRKRFKLKYGNQRPFRKFAWEESFKEEAITNERDLCDKLRLLNEKSEGENEVITYCNIDFELCGMHLAGLK